MMRWPERILLICLGALTAGCDTGGGTPELSSESPSETEVVNLRRIRQHLSGWTSVPQFQADWWRDSKEDDPPLVNARHIRTSSGNLVLSTDGTYKFTLLLDYATADFDILSIEKELEGRFERHGNMIQFDPDRGLCDGAAIFGYAGDSALMVYLGTQSAPLASEWAHHALVTRLEFEPLRVQAADGVEGRPNQSYEAVVVRNDGRCSTGSLPHEAGAASMSGRQQQRLEAATLELGEKATIRASWTEWNIGPGATNQLTFELTTDYERAGNLVFFPPPIDSFALLDGNELIAYQLPMLRVGSSLRRVTDLNLRLLSD